MKKNLPIYHRVAPHGNAKMLFGQHVPLYSVAHQNQNTDATTYLAARDYCQLPFELHGYIDKEEKNTDLCI